MDGEDGGDDDIGDEDDDLRRSFTSIVDKTCCRFNQRVSRSSHECL